MNLVSPDAPDEQIIKYWQVTHLTCFHLFYVHIYAFFLKVQSFVPFPPPSDPSYRFSWEEKEQIKIQKLVFG